MKTKSIAGSSVSRIDSRLGKIGNEYGTVSELPPKLLIWMRQSTDSDKRERLSMQFRRTHAVLERATVYTLGNVLGDLSTKILDRFKAAGTVAVQVSELFHQAELATPFNHVMRPAWLRAAEAGVQFEAEWAGAVKPQLYVATILQKEGDQLPSIDVEMSAGLQRSVREWLKARTEGVWSTVAKTVHTRLEAALKRGLKNGLTLPEMTAEIEATLKGVKTYQAHRIARTETTGGMNFGGQAERTDLGIGHKEWVSTIDGRTRGIRLKDRYDHITPNGQIVENDKPFLISGQKLTYPADGSLGASAGNICNCRCCSVGAWPNKPLKPIIVPHKERPKGWIEPAYETATIPSSPMPKREHMALAITQDERDQAWNFRNMDTEQRSQQTVDRINLVRKNLTSANDTLEEIRLKLARRQDEIETLEAACKQAKEELEKIYRTNDKPAILAQLNKFTEADKALRKARVYIGAQLAEDVGVKAKANVAAVMSTENKGIEDKATQAVEWLSRLLSEKHGKSVTVKIDQSVKDGAYYSRVSKTCFFTQSDDIGTHLHEMGHKLEDDLPKLHDLCKGFLHHRGGTEVSKWVGFRNISEIGVEDDWKKVFGERAARYAGKYYDGATEILSMGMEKLYNDPLGFAKKDPEYFKFIVGVLRGDLL